jgi:Tol biopolymer transport system component
MVYVQFGKRLDSNILRIPDRAGAGNPEPQMWISSSQPDSQPAYSPDGRRIAFVSWRSGFMSIWVSDADGGNPIQLTSFEAHTGTPRWSPDGRRIAFDSQVSGNFDLYVVDALKGGNPRRLTDSPSNDNVGTFSRDGTMIYFSSDRTGRSEIWRRPADGSGEAVQLTRNGGWYAEESRDGRYVYFDRGFADRTVMRIPVGGGEETEVLRAPYGSEWTLAENGIYYASWEWKVRWRRVSYAIRYLDLGSGRVTAVFRAERPVFPTGLTISPDERSILYAEAPLPESELMLVENFR